jgi:DNA-binding MarR family transcriptional regulator
VGGVAPDGGPPLARLFAIAYRSLVDGLHAELRARGWDDVRPAYGFVLLATRDGPTTVTALTALLGTTKQATSKLVDKMEAAGYVRRVAGDGDGRQRPVHLTRRGSDLLATVEEIYGDLESDWADAIGAKAIDRLRRDLVQVLAATHGGQLPPVRPSPDRDG